MALNDSRVFAALTLAGFMLAVQGCQSGGGNSLFGGGGQGQATSAPPEGKVLESELRAYCPTVTLREGTAFYNTYERGADGDSSKLIYQAAITDVTRSCSRNAGMMSIKVGVAGRVVPGPSGKAGTVTMPIRVAVVRGDEVLYSQLFQQQTSLGADASQFVFTADDISIPVPSQRDVQIFAGFDEGPQKKAAAE